MHEQKRCGYSSTWLKKQYSFLDELQTGDDLEVRRDQPDGWLERGARVYAATHAGWEPYKET